MTASQTYSNNLNIATASGGASLLEVGGSVIPSGSQSALAGQLNNDNSGRVGGGSSPGPNSLQAHHISTSNVQASASSNGVNHQGNRR